MAKKSPRVGGGRATLPKGRAVPAGDGQGARRVLPAPRLPKPDQGLVACIDGRWLKVSYQAAVAGWPARQSRSGKRKSR